jgi:hypothetical protein
VNTGRALKEQGQQLALFNAGASWVEKTLEKLREFCAHLKQSGQTKFRFEQFRAAASDLGLEQPASHKAWGAIPRQAVKAKIISPTNEYQPAQSEKTHAHPVRVWQIL